MQRAIFNYPKEFTTLPEYTAHTGQVVTVIRPLTNEEADQGGDLELMYLVRADDGQELHAFESELDTAS